jgi:beta-lactamase regulating signal transducer with metallopeptidase domain
MEAINRYALTFLVNALWQVPVVALATAAACRLLRGSPARHRNAVCILGLFAALALPASGLWRSSPERPVTVVQHRLDVTPSAAAPVPSPAAAPAIPVPSSAANFALWALGLYFVWRVARLGVSAAATLRICRAAEPNTRDCDVWTQCREALGIDHAELRWSRAVCGPVTAGRLIVLPESMADAPDDILRTAIGHEAAHIARADFAVNLACELVALPISFHPATAWFRREIARTRELACDELVTERLVAPETYARAIVRIAATVSGIARPEYTLGVLDGDILEERVRRLLAGPVANLKRARLMLAAAVATLAVCGVIASGLAISARAQTPAQQEMRAAATAYNSGDFTAAARHFEQAVGMEPANLNARLFLANTYLRLRRPDVAAVQYREVLRRDPNNTVAISGVVSLNGMDRPEESRELIQRAISLDPKDPHPYYSLAVLDWGTAYKAITAVNGGPGPDMYRQIADSAARARLRADVGPRIDEGIRMLQRSLELDPDSSDAAAYMNLLDRLQMPLADDAAEHARLLAQADDWVRKALQARANHPNRDVQIDADGPPPAAVPGMVPAPPPPPPPPPAGNHGNGDHPAPPPPPPPPLPAK